MTIQDVVIRVRRLIDDPDTPDDSDIIEYINEGRREIARETNVIEGQYVFPWVENTYKYDVPSYVSKITKIEDQRLGHRQELKEVTNDFMEKHDHTHVGDPYIYRMDFGADGKQIKVYPTPSGSPIIGNLTRTPYTAYEATNLHLSTTATITADVPSGAIYLTLSYSENMQPGYPSTVVAVTDSAFAPLCNNFTIPSGSLVDPALETILLTLPQPSPVIITLAPFSNTYLPEINLSYYLPEAALPLNSGDTYISTLESGSLYSPGDTEIHLNNDPSAQLPTQGYLQADGNSLGYLGIQADPAVSGQIYINTIEGGQMSSVDGIIPYADKLSLAEVTVTYIGEPQDLAVSGNVEQIFNEFPRALPFYAAMQCKLTDTDDVAQNGTTSQLQLFEQSYEREKARIKAYKYTQNGRYATVREV